MSFDYPVLHTGRLRVHAARSRADVDAAQTFRAQRFGLSSVRDQDPQDADCDHIVIHDRESDAMVCCFRVRALTGGTLSQSYAAQYYDLRALEKFDGPFLELGRFCVDPAWCRDPDVFRLAWSAITACVDVRGITLLFGCASFKGTDPAPYSDAFALLQAQALAPACWAPMSRAKEIYPFGQNRVQPVQKRLAQRQMPPLLRTYLGMGGWVSDHAVIDREMNTLHVFTGVETATIPPARQRVLRALHRNSQTAQ